MQYCDKCGFKLPPNATICSGCGSEVISCDSSIQNKTPQKLSEKLKDKKLWIVIGAVVLCVALIAAILFAPRDLKIGDIKETSVVGAVIRYGLPEKIRSDEDGLRLSYGDKIDFYGITPYSFAVYPEANEVVFFFQSDDGDEVYKKIDRYCDFEENLLNMFHEFSYDNLYITTYDYDGSYLKIEID